MMNNEKFQLTNIKCGGCATIIEDGLSDMAGVDQVTVDVAEGVVEVTSAAEISPQLRQQLVSKFTDLGYPLK